MVKEDSSFPKQSHWVSGVCLRSRSPIPGLIFNPHKTLGPRGQGHPFRKPLNLPLCWLTGPVDTGGTLGRDLLQELLV